MDNDLLMKRGVEALTDRELAIELKAYADSGECPKAVVLLLHASAERIEALSKRIVDLQAGPSPYA